MADTAAAERAKHTPGPWSVPHFASPDVNCECGYVLCDGLMGAVCTVHCSGEGEDWKSHGDNPRYEEACANARLIAAAPAMYEALKTILDIDAKYRSGLLGMGRQDRDAIVAAAAEVLAAAEARS